MCKYEDPAAHRAMQAVGSAMAEKRYGRARVLANTYYRVCNRLQIFPVCKGIFAHTHSPIHTCANAHLSVCTNKQRTSSKFRSLHNYFLFILSKIFTFYVFISTNFFRKRKDDVTNVKKSAHINTLINEYLKIHARAKYTIEHFH